MDKSAMEGIDKTRPSHQYREREDTESANKTSLQSMSQSAAEWTNQKN